MKLSEKKLFTKNVDKINYIATIKIPKINLEKGLVEPSSDLNNIKYGIQILKDSSMPNKEKSNLILASSYFFGSFVLPITYPKE